jgi:hypothetical protein
MREHWPLVDEWFTNPDYEGPDHWTTEWSAFNNLIEMTEYAETLLKRKGFKLPYQDEN